MATKANIIGEIDLVFGRFRYVYNVWTIGVTNDPAKQKEEWGYPTFWHEWRANSVPDAESIQRYYAKKGMKSLIDEHLSTNKAVYVYMF
jgi:hypothetical protein